MQPPVAHDLRHGGSKRLAALQAEVVIGARAMQAVEDVVGGAGQVGAPLRTLVNRFARAAVLERLESGHDLPATVLAWSGHGSPVFRVMGHAVTLLRP